MSKLSYTMGMLTLAGAAGVALEAADATTTTENFNLNVPNYSTFTATTIVTSETPITVAGASAPQYYFGSVYEPCGAITHCAVGSSLQYVAIDYIQTAAAVSTGAGFLGTADPYYGTPFGGSALGVKGVTPGLPGLGETFTKSIEGTDLYAAPKTYTPHGGQPVDLSNIDELAYIAGGYTGATPDIYLHTTFELAGNSYYGTFDIDGSGDLESITYVVPEPDAWALIITGAAMVGGVVRSRRRKASLAA